MGRYRGAACRLCRREGTKLFLKGARCTSPKCAFERKAYKPGQGGDDRRSRRPSDYAQQLREKQKMKSVYGLLEKQFRRYVRRAERKEGVTSELLVQALETRLDNAVFRAGLAGSRAQARQLVSHRHITVNEQIVTVASYAVRPGDVIKVREKSKEIAPVAQAAANAGAVPVPAWLQVDYGNLTATVVALPQAAEAGTGADEQQVIEFYSR